MRTVHCVRRSIRLAGCAIGLIAAVAACGARNPEDGAPPKPGASKDAPGSTKPDKPQANQGADVKLRRLESVTWNPVTQELTWVLSTGELNGNGYAPGKQESYVIHMDAATMSVKGEDRHFDADEAEQVGKVMDLICRYALESTIWWEHGGGEKLEHAPGTKTLDPTMNDPADKSNGPADKGKDQPNKPRPVPPGMLRGAIQIPAGTMQAEAKGAPDRQ